MTPLDLVYDLRLRGDDAGGNTGTPSVGFSYVWEENDSNTLWKNEELIRYLNIAHLEIAVRSQCYRDAGESDICQIRVRAGTASYTIDPRILTIEDILLDSSGASLIKTHLKDYRALANHRTTTGTPTHYLEESRPFKITLYPVPVINDILYVTVYRLPLEEMTWNLRNSDVDEPPESLREALIQGALMYAYQKRDADTADAGRQKFHAQEFERLVGPVIDYRTQENRRASANLDVSVTPHAYIKRGRVARGWYEED